MKILYFSTYFYPYISGLTTSPYNVLTCLEEKGHLVTVLTFPHDKKLPSNETINQLRIVRMPYITRLSKGFISPQSVAYFYTEAKNTDCIMLNAPNFEGFFLAIIGFFMGKKIITIYNCSVFLNNGFLSGIITTFLNLSVWLQLTLSKKIIMFTPDYAKSLSLSESFLKKVVYILPAIRKPSVDGVYASQLRKTKGKSYWIGFVGRIAREKGVEFLIKALEKLHKKMPVTLVLAGPNQQVVGENTYGKYINKLLTDSSLPHISLGVLNNRRLGSLYKNLDVLVLPSINKTEAFGMVQAEAMMLETPCVSTNLAGIQIPIQLTKMGLSVPPGDTQQLYSAVKTILENRKKYTGKIMQKKAEQIFNIKTVCQSYENILLS